MRRMFVFVSTILLVGTFFLAFYLSVYWYNLLAVLLFFTIIGYADMFQKKHTIKRLYPLLGRLRYFMEDIRPKVYQYFVESDLNGSPLNRIDRSTIYQRSKDQTDTMPFGSQLNMYDEGYEWVCHSIGAKYHDRINENPRILIGNKDCKQPYDSSVLNISAMSYGSLSSNAVEAMNGGAKIGGFAHNTGEGGVSPYHLKHGGDLIWQIGTGYFGCRTDEGTFSPERFQEKATLDNVKMIEIKLSQGAKPGHGGILPASKNTPEIAAIRHVKPYTKVDSPPNHKSFDSPEGLILFIKQLRELSGGKPVGFKLCIGYKSEFIGICKAMIKHDTYPDFITVDGGEGGTGAAPQEFSNYVGAPLLDGLAFVHDMLRGFGIRQHIKVIASGKIITGFHMLRAMALGADGCNCARAMMLAVGCIQALLCNKNTCPTGVATQDPKLSQGLDVNDKKQRVARYHQKTIKNFNELIGASGLPSMDKISRSHIYRRVSLNEMITFEEIFPTVKERCLVEGEIPQKYIRDIQLADSESFGEPLRIGVLEY